MAGSFSSSLAKPATRIETGRKAALEARLASCVSPVQGLVALKRQARSASRRRRFQAYIVFRLIPDRQQNSATVKLWYFMQLDWTGREFRADKRGAIPKHLAPIVERLGLNPSNWVETVRGFGRLFKQAAGRSSLLVDAAGTLLEALVPG
jgi:hypothetical protein